MPAPVTFVLSGPPIPQPRQRIRKLPGNRMMNYTPRDHPVQSYKQSLALSYLNQGKRLAFAGIAVVVDVLFVFRDPALTTLLPHVLTPDTDNLLKSVLDALKGVAWNDDAVVCDLFGRKRWGPTAYTRVEIREFELPA